MVTTDIAEIANAIQMSVAPAFLLTGIGAIITAMANRLARVIDRYRALSEEPSSVEDVKKSAEIELLVRRSRWVNRAIYATTASALLVCVVVVVIFVSSSLQADPKIVLEVLFIMAMMALIVGLICFMREIQLTTRYINPPKKTVRRRAKKAAASTNVPQP